MGVPLGKYNFEGPYRSTFMLENDPGIFVVLCGQGKPPRVLDVGEAAQIRYAVEMHEAKTVWETQCSEGPSFAAFYTPHLDESGRQAIVEEIRARYAPFSDDA